MIEIIEAVDIAASRPAVPLSRLRAEDAETAGTFAAVLLALVTASGAQGAEAAPEPVAETAVPVEVELVPEAMAAEGSGGDHHMSLVPGGEPPPRFEDEGHIADASPAGDRGPQPGFTAARAAWPGIASSAAETSPSRPQPVSGDVERGGAEAPLLGPNGRTGDVRSVPGREDGMTTGAQGHEPATGVYVRPEDAAPGDGGPSAGSPPGPGISAAPREGSKAATTSTGQPGASGADPERATAAAAADARAGAPEPVDGRGVRPPVPGPADAPAPPPAVVGPLRMESPEVQPEPAAEAANSQPEQAGAQAFRTALRVYRRQDETAVTARVSSPSLGPVRVEVVSGKRGLDATVFASDPASRSLLAGELGSLRDTLAGTGVNVRNLDVRADLPGAGGDGPHGGDAARDGSRGHSDGGGGPAGKGQLAPHRGEPVDGEEPRWWGFSVMA